MADESCDASEIFTAFLLNTCRLPSWPSQHRLQAAVYCATFATAYPRDDEAEFIPLVTGSVAEFYIEPMLPHVGDIDVMHYSNNFLAIPRGHPPPTHLPAEFHNYVKVCEIIDSQLPGYVYLPLRYLLSQRTDDGKYEYFEFDDKKYSAAHSYVVDDTKYETIHGPAICTDNSRVSYGLSTDLVPCARCLSWPSQADDWQHDTETTVGQTQQLLIVLSATDVMWLVWRIVSVDKMNGWTRFSIDCHSHEQKLY